MTVCDGDLKGKGRSGGIQYLLVNKSSSVCGQTKAELDFLSRTSSNNRIVLS